MNASTILLTAAMATAVFSGRTQDWPQWRGPNRDGKAADFKAPKTWPKELKQQWNKTVGSGDASPSLVGNKLYVFSREGDSEVLRALNLADGAELWQDKYETGGATGPASGHAGPRSSPSVANGKVVTYGVRGILSCVDAESGKLLWRKDEIKGWPTFFTSSSPIITDGMVIAQLGGATNGTVAAYDLETGRIVAFHNNEQWKWTGNGTAYASPVLLKAGGINAVIVETDKSLVALTLHEGKQLWEMPFAGKGMGGYNASTPVVSGTTVIFSGSGRGTRAIKFEKKGDALQGTELWSNPERSAVFNSPVLKDGLVYGITQGHEFFCLDAKDGKSLWSAPVPQPGAPDNPPEGGRRRGNRTSGYGSIVDGGTVLLALTPASELIVFKPSEKEYSEVARIKVSDTPTFAHLVASGNRLITKDQNSVTVWTVE